MARVFLYAAVGSERHNLFLTSVELHESWDQLIDGDRVVLHHLEEALGAGLHRRVGDEQHLHQLGDQVRVADVVLTADEDDQEGHDVLSARLVQHLRRVPAHTPQSVSNHQEAMEFKATVALQFDFTPCLYPIK